MSFGHFTSARASVHVPASRN